MTEPTAEEWTTAYNTYADKARRTGAKSIPTQEAMLSTAFGRAVLLCRVMEMRTARMRRQQSQKFQSTQRGVTRSPNASPVPHGYWWQEKDD